MDLSAETRSGSQTGRRPHVLRRRIVVEGFQKRFVITLMAWLAVALAFLTVIVFAPSVTALMGSDEAQRALVADSFLSLHSLVWPLLAAVFVATGLILVLMTHGVAGPLYRFRRIFADVERGVLTMRVRLREDDYLKDEAAALDAMVASLRDRVDTVKTLQASACREVQQLRVRDGAVTPDELAHLEFSLDQVRAALDVFDTDASSAAEQQALLPTLDTQPARTVPPRRPAHDGFTLIEVLLVVCVLGISASIAVPIYSHSLNMARTTKAIADLESIEQLAKIQQMRDGCLPSALADIGFGDLLDPWGRPYQYAPIRPPGAAGCTACSGGCINQAQARKDKNLHPVNTDFDVFSLGADGQTAGPLNSKVGADDVVRANNGGFFGLGKDY